jgi:cytidylate kinase
MAVITISRQFGAGGKTIGQKVAETLGYTFIDEDIIQIIAEKAKVSPGWVESVEKEAGGRLSRIVTKMVSRPLIDKVLKEEYGYIDEQIYIDYLVVIIAQMAEEGNVVFLDRGSQYILNDFPDAFHILLINTFDNRVKFMMNRYDLNQQRAMQVVKSEEKRRTNLYRKIGKQDFDQPELYHLVINMARIDLDDAVRLILQLVTPKPA